MKEGAEQQQTKTVVLPSEYSSEISIDRIAVRRLSAHAAAALLLHHAHRGESRPHRCSSQTAIAASTISSFGTSRPPMDGDSADSARPLETQTSRNSRGMCETESADEAPSSTASGIGSRGGRRRPSRRRPTYGRHRGSHNTRVSSVHLIQRRSTAIRLLTQTQKKRRGEKEGKRASRGTLL
jgi:hypothetical protein